MSTKTENGGPAFPQNDAVVNRINNEAGMSLRDYFAAQALTGLAANTAAIKATEGDADTHIAEWCYQIADAMLAERAK